MATPRADRAYNTNEQFAEHLGVGVATLYRWKKSKEIKETLALAAMDWGEQQLPKVVNALFTYAQRPSGDKDRMTIVRYFMPAVLKARAENQFDKLEQAGAGKQINKELAMAYLEDCSIEEQEKFMRIFQALGTLGDTGQAEDEPEPYQIERRNDEDVLDLVPIPPAPATGKPGRPRNSRSVRLTRPEPQAQ
jgi:hypothetical protein